MKLVHRALFLIAMVSVSGIHLAFMQAGAWAFMLHDRESEVEAVSLSFIVAEFISGAKPCQRCLITTRASLDSHPGTGGDLTFAIELKDLRLAPVQFSPIRLNPPVAGFKPVPEEEKRFPGRDGTAPPSPPPEPDCLLLPG